MKSVELGHQILQRSCERERDEHRPQEHGQQEDLPIRLGGPS